MTYTPGKQFGPKTMQVQASSAAQLSTSTASVSAIQFNGTDVEAGEKAILSGDNLQTQGVDGALSDYTNPDLESVLSALGFSTIRPAMLAAFEFQPFIDESTIKTSSSSISSKNISTTSAAEMADMHSQLKQVRCSEVMEFLEKYVGLTTKDVYTGTGIEFSTSSDDKGVLDGYESKMDDAKEIIETLTTIYNAILPMLEAMQIKTNDYNGGSRGWRLAISKGVVLRGRGYQLLASNTTPSGKIQAILADEEYNNDWTTSAVISDISLKEYITDYLGFQSEFYTSSSGNVIFTQLMLDVVIRLFYPVYTYNDLTSYEQYQAAQQSSWIRASAAEAKDAMYGSGHIEELATVTNAVSRLAHLAVGGEGESATLGAFSSSHSSGTSSVFTMGDFTRLWNTFAPDGDAGSNASQINLGMGLNIIASDVMAYYARKSSKLSLDDYVDGIGSSTSADDIMKALFGTRTGFSNKNIADLAPTKTGTCLAVSFPKNTDASTDNGKVSTFSYSQNALSQGSYTLRTGKSFYVDEIFTGEMGSVKKRLIKLQDRIDQSRSNLLNTAQRMKFPDSVSTRSSSRTRASMGKQSAVETLTPSSLTHRLYEKAANQLENKLSSLESGVSNHWCRLGVCILASQDKILAWKLFKFYMLLYAVKDSGLSLMSYESSVGFVAGETTKEDSPANVQEELAELFDVPDSGANVSSTIDIDFDQYASTMLQIWNDINDIIEEIARWTINENPGFQGAYAEWSTEDAPSGGGSSIFAGEAEGDDLADALKGIGAGSSYFMYAPDDPTYFGVEEITSAFWELVEDASTDEGASTSSPSSCFTFGFEAFDAFMGDVKSTYSTGIGRMSRTSTSDNDLHISLDNRTPLADVRFDGAMAISFFFQLHIWRSLSFIVQDGDDTSFYEEQKAVLEAMIEATAALDGTLIDGWANLLYAYNFVGSLIAEGIYNSYVNKTLEELEEELERLEDSGGVLQQAGNVFLFGARAVTSLTYAVESALDDKVSPDTIASRIEGDEFTGDWDGVSGGDGKISKYLDQMELIYWKQVESEKNLWNSMWFVNGIMQEMYSAVTSLLGTLEGNNLSGGNFEDVFDNIRANDSLRRALFLCVTRDQLSLNASLYDSLSVSNREYPYLPATKVVMRNQIKNLATISTISDLVNTEESGKKRVLAIGIPAGFVDRLRNEAIDKGLGLKYFKSSVISIEVWRRNMADDSEVTIPKEFKFDLSKFIIEGRAKSTGDGSDVLDAAAETEDGQTVADVLNNTVVTTYTPENEAYTTMGKAYSKESLSSSSKGTQIFQNLVVDHYLKLYIKSTTGFDVTEEIFPVQPKKIFIDSPDPDKSKLFAKLEKELAESFPTRDVTSAINYDRLLGELTRSILLSPSKWANRVFYPKIFDRVICILVDEDDFGPASDESGYDTDYVVDLATGEVNYESASSSLAVADIDETHPTYYQFFCTASILSPMSDEQSDEDADLNPDTEVG